ncbi:polyphosphate polymerase domain-containing protein [Dactylosporangium siamense]|uniref:VTC domain-containing protein n=1 Tax=Dactylosporangium siamense TaxID=685454 RepID=A0A919U8N3_9ACTN|nr:polyphosphate polymerase domain-containing protein [Dactylosporangium siamense]GIG42955.1 VTC domain-containing protein [Dactylosporangium siamense]
MMAGLEPIGLDELVAQAALLTRVDRKYLLPADRLPRVLRGLAGTARVLDIDGRRRFGYRSDYFDTPGLDSYLAAAHRRRRRCKVRVRTYLDTGGRYVEVKTRGPRGTTVKERIRYRGGIDHLSAGALDGIHVPWEPELLRPVLITRYERTTLYLPASGGRVTVDAALSWHLDDGTTLRAPDRVIVETKAAGGACEADRLLWSFGHRPCSVSKYGTGLAALRPDLPANRWRSTLRRHFPSAPSNRES